jgi:multidrug transporter EmrE-like cation transporter
VNNQDRRTRAGAEAPADGYAMNPVLKAALVCVLSIGSLSLANILLKVGMDRWGLLEAAGGLSWRTVAVVWQLPLGVVLMTAQFLGMLTLFKWGWDASVVVPIFGFNYVLTAMLGRFWLGEPVAAVRWLGIALVIAGVALIARSAPVPGSS